MTMVERVARALFKSHYPGGDPDKLWRLEPRHQAYIECSPDGEHVKIGWVWFEHHARASIEAMREPTGFMLVAMMLQGSGASIGDLEYVWIFAIDAALSEEP